MYAKSDKAEKKLLSRLKGDGLGTRVDVTFLIAGSTGDRIEPGDLIRNRLTRSRHLAGPANVGDDAWQDGHTVFVIRKKPYIQNIRLTVKPAIHIRIQYVTIDSKYRVVIISTEPANIFK